MSDATSDAASGAAFADRLARVRAQYKDEHGEPITYTAMARMLGIAIERYRRWERGEMEPNIKMLALIHARTGVSLDWLIAGGGQGVGSNPQPGVTFAARLSWTRHLLSRTQREAAQLLGVSPRLWGRWESGQAEPPIGIMMEFCQRYGVGLDFLYRGQLTGISPKIGDALLTRHPQLRLETPAAAPRKPRNGNGRRIGKALPREKRSLQKA